MPHTKEFYETFYWQLLDLHSTLAAEKVLVGLEDQYESLLATVRECLDDLRETVHPRDAAEIVRLLHEQETLAQEVAVTVKWANEQKDNHNK